MDIKNYGFLFPGQGAQFAGMGKELYEEFDEAKEVFTVASDTLNYDIAGLCFDGPEGKLVRTDVCQPAILTVSIAALRTMAAISDTELQPNLCSGLSLGEYSALVAGGSLELADAVELTAARGKFMQEACDMNPGTMYSILGLEPEKVEEACRIVREKGGKVWPANYNSASQLVISGETDAAAEAAALCDEYGARRAIQLEVAGAFHTPLMQPASDKLSEKLEKCNIRQPETIAVANVTARPHDDPDQIRSLLARQVVEPVKWLQSMNWCKENNCLNFVEIGPGKVISGLMRRIDRSLKCQPVLSPESIKDYLNLHIS